MDISPGGGSAGDASRLEQPVAKPPRRSTGDPSRLNRAALRRSSLRFGRNTPGIPPSRALSAGRLAPSCCENAAWLSNGSRTGQDRRSGLERRLQPAPRPQAANGITLVGLTACGKTHAAFDGRSIPPEPRRLAALIVAFRSKYTRYSSLTRLVSRAPRPQFSRWGPRRSRGFHHRPLARISHTHGPGRTAMGRNPLCRGGFSTRRQPGCTERRAASRNPTRHIAFTAETAWNADFSRHPRPERAAERITPITFKSVHVANARVTRSMRSPG